MITEELLKECRLEFEENIQSLILDLADTRQRVEDIRAHSMRVVGNSILISGTVLDNEEDKRLAEVIALFHDLGRATLIVQGIETPASIQRDHAALSVKLIQQIKFFSRLPADIQLIIEKSIDNHNKYKPVKPDNERVSLFSRILRDADKLDVYESSYRFLKERWGVQPIITFDLVNSSEISEKIIKSVVAGKTAAIEDLKTMNDYKLFLLSMVFDVNFKYTFRLISEKQYIQKVYETLPKRDQIIDLYRGIKLFVENKFIS